MLAIDWPGGELALFAIGLALVAATQLQIRGLRTLRLLVLRATWTLALGVAALLLAGVVLRALAEERWRAAVAPSCSPAWSWLVGTVAAGTRQGLSGGAT